MPKPTKTQAKRRLQRALDSIPQLKQLRRNSSKFKKWHRDTLVAITNTFGGSSSHAKEFGDIEYSLWIISGRTPESAYQKAYVSGLESAEPLLQSMIDEIEEYWEDDSQSPQPSDAGVMPQWANTNQVFIIHGRDHGTRDTVTRFLERLGLEPLILQEQPDRGRTIIEKFEDHAQCNFAVALFTPDDVGGLTDDALQPRSRQNVIFEFGYFIGKLGRDRVRALVKGNPEIPSDYSGVLYIPIDKGGGWRMRLIGELTTAGFNIDANRAFEESS